MLFDAIGEVIVVDDALEPFGFKLRVLVRKNLG